MVGYESYREDVERIYKLVTTEMIEKIAFRQFEQDRGTAVTKVLPDKSDSYEFQSHGLGGVVDPDRRAFDNPMYESTPFTMSRVTADPASFTGLIDAVYESWSETFGKHHRMSSQPSHPGKPPIDKDSLRSVFDQLASQKELLTADPTLDDLVDAVEDKHYRFAAQFLNLDEDAQVLFRPGGDHELTALFTHGDVDIVYRDREVALLKPTYDHGLREQIINQQRNRLGRVRLRGEQPELAFVVGLDDTPTGLFAHSVDGTRLDTTQTVTRDTIHDVMEFDYNYHHESVLDCEMGDRVRLQGDLAVQYVSNTTSRDSAQRCNLPIDNHLVLLNHGTLSVGETRDEEPIRVDIPSFSTVNIMHDEHDNVSAELPAGQYEFYLLPRGLQPEDERPGW